MSFITAASLADARDELCKKTPERIEYETAAKWASRAVAAYEMYLRGGNLQYRDLSVCYQHEAVEHAADAGPAMADQMTAELRRAIGRLG